MGGAHLFIVALGALSLALSAFAVRRDTPLDWRFAPVSSIAATGAANFQTVFDYTVATGQAHSPAIMLRDDGFDVMWFEGSEEAQADVDIHHASFVRSPKGWAHGQSGPLVTRGGLSEAFEPGQIVVTLGNTIENEAVPKALYATVASVGGWAMASIVDVRRAGGVTQSARKLNLSPFLNRSHLVKSPMLAYADGSQALPAYFELGRTHGVLVRLSADGRVRDARRMSGFGKPIQPMIVPLDCQRAVAFLRDFDPSGQLLVSHTVDGGQSWSRVAPAGMANPSSPVAALGLGGGTILMAVNDDIEHPETLRLKLSEDGGDSWRDLHAFRGEDGALRYPMMRRVSADEIVLTYSRGTKRGVVAHVFNRAWIDQTAEAAQ